jgi:hypothetical protein
MRERQGVLITGVFGSGKTSVAVEMADILEKRGVPYAVLDLDWLAWGWPGSAEADAEHQMMLRNLAPVVRNYLDAGCPILHLRSQHPARFGARFSKSHGSDALAGHPFDRFLARNRASASVRHCHRQGRTIFARRLPKSPGRRTPSSKT